jgi:N-acetylneuraminate synthase
MVADNVRERVVPQRRCIRAKSALQAGTVISRDQLDVLRPCPPGAIEPYRMSEVVGRTLRRSLPPGEQLRWTDF